MFHTEALGPCRADFVQGDKEGSHFLSFTSGHPAFLESFVEGAVFLPVCALVFLTVLIWGDILRSICCGSLNVLWNLALNPSGPGLFFSQETFLICYES